MAALSCKYDTWSETFFQTKQITVQSSNEWLVIKADLSNDAVRKIQFIHCTGSTTAAYNTMN